MSVAAVTLLLLIPFVASSPDLGAIVYVLITLPVLSFILCRIALRKTGRQRLPPLLMLAAFWAGSAMAMMNYSAVRDATRWFLWSRDYKAKVLSQADSGNAELRHTEWDGWGFVGMDTVVYLVFDPGDSLATISNDHSAVRFEGIPCRVPRIRRLESHWYAVMFYTDTSWGHCG